MMLLMLIALLSIIQSIFGIGLLVFGTPILLFLGYPFDEILSFLLPCSLVISAMQAFHGWGDTGPFRNKFLIYTVPFVVIGLLLALFLSKVDIKVWVGAMLLMTGLLRTFPHLQKFLHQILRRTEKIYLVCMGLIHGLTNMGGGLLTILISSLFSHKEVIRANISFGYLVMAFAQLIVLAASGHLTIQSKTILYPFSSLLIYWLVGQKIFRASTAMAYQQTMTVFIFIFGISLILI